MIKYSKKTGIVGIRDFDLGIMARLGAVADIRTHDILKKRNGYWLDLLPTAVPAGIPVIFNEPEAIYERRVFPSILVARGDPEPDMIRWQSVGSLDYFTGVSGTEETATVFGETVSGFAEVESKIQAMPFNFNYTITAFARWEHEALPMLTHLLKRFQAFARIPVVDSIGDTRTYTTFSDGGWQNQSELVDVADRMKAYAVSVKVEGELDLNDPVVRSTVRSFVTTLNRQR